MNRLLALALVAYATALAGCATAAPNRSWTLRVTPPDRACVYAVKFDWDGIAMVEHMRRAYPKACASLTGWLTVDEPVPTGPFSAKWTDATGKQHSTIVDVRSLFSGYELRGSFIRLELANDGLRGYIAEVPRAKIADPGFVAPGPEVLAFVVPD